MVTAERQHAIDANALTSSRNLDDGADDIICGLLARGQVVAIVGEEGGGKSLFVEQTCREILRGERALDYFDLGPQRPTRCLIIDTEMGEREVARRCLDMDARGLNVPNESLFYIDAVGLDIGNWGDAEHLRREIARIGAGLVMVDTAAGLIDDAKSDGPVDGLFTWCMDLMRDGVLGVGLTLHPRKAQPGSYGGRSFDDVFGSRSWKGRASRVLWLASNKITAFKDRGARLRDLGWRIKSAGQTEADIERPGLTDPTARPFRITVAPQEEPLDLAAIEAEVLAIVRAEPDALTKTSVVERISVNRQMGLAVISSMIERGVLGPDRPRTKLHVAGEA